MSYVQRHRGSIAFPHRLDRFPFDRHTIRISFLSSAYAADMVDLKVDEHVTGRRDVAFTMPDWEVGNPSAKTGAMPVAFQDQDHALYTFEIEVRRRWSYYVFQIVLPPTLIFAMSWAVFWIDPTHLAPKINLPATAMLTVIAFHFTARNTLPRISYLTVLDWFVLGATILVFLGLLMSLATTYTIDHWQ